jgi:hypothetical protein
VSAELSDEYSIDIDGSMDIPDQTVETEFGEATISEIGKEEAGNVLGVSTNALANETYAIRVIEIVDGDRRNLATDFIQDGGDTETEFSLFGYDPGTYLVVITKNDGSELKAIEPFVVKGYTVDQQVSDVAQGSKLHVTVELTEVASDVDSPQAVNVTFTGNDEVRSTEAEKTGDLQYNATFETDSLSTGQYEVYSGVESGETIFGYNELVGLSPAQGFEITSQEETPTSTSTATETETSTSTPTTTETEESVEGVTTDQATESVTATTPPAQSTESTQSSPSEADPNSAEREGEDTVGATSTVDSPTEDSTPSDQTDQESMTRTEVAETTATTPVIPNLVIWILMLTTVLVAQRLHD